MRLYTIESGLMGNNTYIVVDEDSKCAAIIDPARRNKELEHFIKENSDISFEYIFLTHAHFDHSRDAGRIRALTGAKIALHRLENALLEEELAKDGTPGTGDILLSGGETLTCGKLNFEIIHTPGHTAGGICIICGDIMFTGDTLFKGTIGRTDLGGDAGQMRNTLKNILAKIERDFLVLPGHGERTTLAEEQKSNLYLCI